MSKQQQSAVKTVSPSEPVTEKPLAQTALDEPARCGKQRGYFVCNERKGHKGGHKTWESGRIVFAWPNQ